MEKKYNMGDKSGTDSNLSGNTNDMLIVKSPNGGISSKESFASTLKTRSSRHSDRSYDEDPETAFLFLGGIQMMLGVLMAVFGVLSIIHDASMSSVGAGLWGGAVAMAAGVVGLLAGLRRYCMSTEDGQSFSRLAVTAFLALGLVALAIGNLVVVVAAAGLVRDINRLPDDQGDDNLAVIKEEEGEGFNLAPVLANCGLVLVSSLECIIAIISSYRCYRLVCPCTSERIQEPETFKYRLRAPDSPEPAGSFYSTSSKDRLITKWLGQQTQSRSLLLVPQPMMPSPCAPIYTLSGSSVASTPPPIMGYHMTSRHFINPMVPVQYSALGVHNMNHLITNRAIQRRRRRDLGEERRRKRLRDTRKKPKPAKENEEKPITEEDVAKTYTGLDREIAEEFIAIAMEPGAGKYSTIKPVSEL